MNISDFLAGTPVNAVLRERITLLLEDKERLDKQAAALQTENATLRKRITELERDVTAEAVSNEFVPHRGVFFKRKPTGDMTWVYIVHNVRGRCIRINMSRRIIAPSVTLRRVLVGMNCMKLGVNCHDRDV